VRKGICDLRGMSYKSLYLPKYQTLQYFGYVVKVKHPQMFLFTLWFHVWFWSWFPCDHIFNYLLQMYKEPWLELTTWNPWANLLALNIFRDDWESQFVFMTSLICWKLNGYMQMDNYFNRTFLIFLKTYLQ